jgi:hypothetical protein
MAQHTSPPKITPDDFKIIDSEQPTHYGKLKLLSKLRPFIRIPSNLNNDNVDKFANLLTGYWELHEPNVLLSITGGAQDFNLNPNLEKIFTTGLIKAARDTSAWIITGGLDAGVMGYVGRAVRDQDSNVPTLAIAPYQKVLDREKLEVHDKEITYKLGKKATPNAAPLEPNHTHFILVDSGTPEWGTEIKFRSALEAHIIKKFKIPLVLVVVEGCPGTIATVKEGIENGFPVVIIEGSGRAADVIAKSWRKAHGESVILEDNPLKLKPDKLKEFYKDLQTIIDKGKEFNNIIVFDSKDEKSQDMSLFLLRAIIGTQSMRSIQKKLILSVQWNREDVVKEILNTAHEHKLEHKSSLLNTTSIATEPISINSSIADLNEDARALNEALHEALARNRYTILPYLIDGLIYYHIFNLLYLNAFI